MSARSDLQDLGAGTARLPGGPRERRRLVARSALHILATTVGLLVLYVFVPVPGSYGAGALVGLIGGLVVFFVLVGLQVHAISRSGTPVLRAIEVVAFALPLLVVVFAFTYLSLSRADPGSFSEHLNRVGALYFTVSTISTVGFGDITADSEAARILVTVQMLVDLALIAGLVRLVMVAARMGLHRREVGGEPRDTNAE